MSVSTRTSAPRPVTPLAIVADTLARICERLDEAGGDVALDAESVSELRRASAIACGLDAYTSRSTTPESEALRVLAERTDAGEWAAAGGPTLEREMLSGHVEGQTLKMLVHATGAREVLEIGMFTGYSALAMAEALQESGHEGRVVACEVDAGVAAFARECFAASPAAGRIDVRVGPALESLTVLADEGACFDLVFVDADKPGYVDYFTTLLERGLLAPGALLCVDNTLLQGEPWTPGATSANGSAIARFNEVVAADPRVEQVLLPVRDGVTLIRLVTP